jgi:hypothetical protein
VAVVDSLKAGFGERGNLEFMTLLLLLLVQPWRQFSPSGSLPDLLARACKGLTALGLAAPFLRERSAFWIGLVLLHFAWIVCAKLVADNHHYLFGYWLMAIAGAVATAAPVEALRGTASLLIGLCFAWAAGAKVLRRRYRNGSFFCHTLAFDARFRLIAWPLGGVDADLARAHRRAFAAVRRPPYGSAIAPVPWRLRWLAQSLTWWTVAI